MILSDKKFSIVKLSIFQIRYTLYINVGKESNKKICDINPRKII